MQVSLNFKFKGLVDFPQNLQHWIGLTVRSEIESDRSGELLLYLIVIISVWFVLALSQNALTMNHWSSEWSSDSSDQVNDQVNDQVIDLVNGLVNDQVNGIQQPSQYCLINFYKRVPTLRLISESCLAVIQSLCASQFESSGRESSPVGLIACAATKLNEHFSLIYASTFLGTD